jgi:uncharacterized protein GlcG (DUF336 family)
MATLIADAAIATCRADSFEATVAVVDRAGVLKLLFRADAANPHTAELVRRKAYTARTFKITTLAFERQSVAGGPLEAQRNIAEVIALGGGAPIMFGKEAVGGIGWRRRAPSSTNAVARRCRRFPPGSPCWAPPGRRSRPPATGG